MEKESPKKLIVAIIVLIIVIIGTIGASFSFFSLEITEKGNKETELSTVVYAKATMDYGERIEANGVFPGNKIIKTIKVEGSGPEYAKPITATLIFSPNVVDFSNHIKYSLYEVENSSINISEICEKSKLTVEDQKYYDAMQCDTSPLGTPILEGVFEGKKIVTQEIEITYNTNRTYYILVEYLNDPNGQDEEQGKTFFINMRFRSVYLGPEINYAFLLNGELITTLPEKNDNYEIEVNCDDGVKREWNKETWSLDVEEQMESDVKCTLSFTRDYQKEILNKGQETGEIAYDETVDNNLRFIGSNPTNYVRFNNELWRIIGFMNNVEDEEGTKETRMKIIRNESIGTYQRHSAANNDWTISTLKSFLNGDYYNELTNESKIMIDNVVWNLKGGTNASGNAQTFYDLERNGSVYSGRPTFWIGNIGLMYPSDYGFAVGGEVREECLNYQNISYNIGDCKINDWLYLGSQEWTITPLSGGISWTASVLSTGVLSFSNARTGIHNVRPTVFLDKNVKIINGEGTEENPYQLSLK